MTAATLERPAKERADGTGPDDGEDEDAVKEGITELEKVTAERVDAVETPANGTPLLIMKASGGAAKARRKGKRARKDSDDVPNGDDGDDDGDDDAGKAATAAAPPPASPPAPAAVTKDAPPWEDYRAAVAQWKALEPSTAGALDGTDFLKAKADWHKWDRDGGDAGLDGTRSGYAKWAQAQVAKRDFDPNVGEHGTDRDQMPASDFVDPKGRRFPIHDASDVSDAVSSYGRADPKIPFRRFKSRLTSIARRKGFGPSLPQKWETATAKEALEDCLAKSVAAGDLTHAQAAERLREEEASWSAARAASLRTKGLEWPEVAAKMGLASPEEAKVLASAGSAAMAKGKKKVMCPACGARQNRGHANCSECGKPLAGAKPVEKNHAYTCLKCGKSLDKGERFCPGCGKRNPGYLPEADSRIPANRAAEKATAKAARAKETLAKAVAARLITEDAAQALLAEVAHNTATAAAVAKGRKKGKGARPVGVSTTAPMARKGRKRMLPASTRPVPAHREPDGSSTVGQLEPDAGIPTRRDKRKDKVPASVSAMGTSTKGKKKVKLKVERATDEDALKGVPYQVLRMHDATCAAYTAKAVMDAYPAMDSIAGAVADGWFAQRGAQAITAKKLGQAAKAMDAAASACFLMAADPAAVADARARLEKSFASMYPSVHLSPSEPRKPGSFQRPYLRAGHAAETPGQGPSAIPASERVPEPQQFGRGYLSGGHASRSPGDHAPNSPNPPDAGGRSYYSAGEAAMAEAAMRSVHDHIASTFAGACPMSPSKTEMPPGMGARNVPSAKPATKLPKDMGGIATVKSTDPAAKADGEPFGGRQSPPFGTKRKKGKKQPMGKRAMRRTMTKVAAASARRTAKALAGRLPDAATLSTIAAGTTQAARTGTDSRLADLEKQVAELGSMPDPALAPVRGQMARAPQGDAAPVEKRSLAAEALQAREGRRAQEREQYLNYLETQAASPDPKVALRAEALLEKEMARP